MRLPQVWKGCDWHLLYPGKKAETTLVNLVTWPEGFKFIDRFRITCYTGKVDRRTLHLGITSLAIPV